MKKFSDAYLLDDLTLISDSFQYNQTPYIKKPNLDFRFWNKIFGAIGVLTGKYYPIYFAEDFFKEQKKT